NIRLSSHHDSLSVEIGGVLFWIKSSEILLIGSRTNTFTSNGIYFNRNISIWDNSQILIRFIFVYSFEQKSKTVCIVTLCLRSNTCEILFRRKHIIKTNFVGLSNKIKLQNRSIDGVVDIECLF